MENVRTSTSRSENVNTITDIFLTKEEQLYYVGHLLALAIEKHGFSITPCVRKISFTDCLTVYGNQVFLWYNSEDNSTRIAKMDLCKN